MCPDFKSVQGIAVVTQVHQLVSLLVATVIVNNHPTSYNSYSVSIRVSSLTLAV